MPADFAPPGVTVEHRSDGTIVLRSPRPLGPYPGSLGRLLNHWAAATPDAVFLAERAATGGWRTLSYGDAGKRAASVAQALIARGLDQSRPVLVLSGNSVDHAVLMLGCFQAGVPIAPISPAYSLVSTDFAKLAAICDLVEPALVYVEAIEPFARALDAVGISRERLVSSSPSGGGAGVTCLSDLAATTPTVAVRERARSVRPDQIAKILFTSGSTGQPKGVINTHGMLSANQQMIRQCWPFLERTRPVLLDWLPWHHTFGGNHNFNLVLMNGGTLYIDAGKPASAAIGVTVQNLREIAPSLYFNVPAGFAMLLPFLERDDDLARRFFSRLTLIFYAGAALPPDSWERLDRLAMRHLGRRIMLTSAWGSTETAPLATTAHFLVDGPGVIGLPAPGVEIKLTPSGSKTELGVRGPSVTPGYFKRPELSRAAFDEEGYYRTGDAGRFADPSAPQKGLIFDGRTAEDFKLTTGTWVHVGALRVAVIAACSPLLQDLVVCGHDRDEVAVLAWPNLAACRELAGEAPTAADMRALLRAPAIVRTLGEALHRHNACHPGASSRIARLHLMADPPSIDADEITDKGYINQRAVLDRRAALVERLLAPEPDPEVLRIP
jgi:feruloyl-CoA synthase